ncbi:MFS polyamine transporter [Lentinus tigrinus ALCF2SS1-7]|uniref:MFS polyamine transporter n=1 Tax=Lentinus tigrinus ALCF2SS1-6 TaxID=1328759 RepID=A0A5C2RV91_9APHY|nr:MFS polyamine transporter [Lentinus tigrinus ALCF2SS1-6]RPD70317.1 MFS polyamine transporter [Lentinus tigrinus ALCF2SS1-7]
MALMTPKIPKNWPFSKKWAVTAVVSAYTFMSPVSSSMMAPASDRIAEQYGITNTTIAALLTSIYVLAYAFGPLVLGPLSELFGRARVLQAANVWYLAWNFGCAFAQNTSQMLAFRFLSGFGGSGTLTIGGGVLGDVWRPEQRGQAIAVYSLAPLLGPVIGPICGAWIAEKGDWRWVFWAPTIVSVATQIVGLFFLKETYAPVLLERKAKQIKKGLDPEKGRMYDVRTVFAGADRQWRHIVQKALFRPFMLFVREPIIQLLGTYMAFVYGTLYLFLTTLPTIFQGVYRESIGIAGLNYIALGLGLSGVSQINARLIDVVYKRLCARNGGAGKPEYRLPSMVPGTFLLPIGLLVTGWTARASVHWIVPDIGIVIVGAGMILNFQSIQTYIIDAFTLHAASALAATNFFRSLAGLGFPLFAPSMYNALGYGKGDTILACAAIAIGIPAPFLFWVYGERLRNASHYANAKRSA